MTGFAAIAMGSNIPPRERALLEYGRLVNQHHLAFQRKWIQGDGTAEDLLTAPDASSAADLNAIVEPAQAMRFAPIDATAIVQLLVSASVPMLVVVLNEVPLARLAKWTLGALL